MIYLFIAIAALLLIGADQIYYTFVVKEVYREQHLTEDWSEFLIL